MTDCKFPLCECSMGAAERCSRPRPAAPVECHPRDTNSVEYHETRNVADKTVEGLETVGKQYLWGGGTAEPWRRYAPIFPETMPGLQTRELVTRSQAEAIIAAERAENDETYELGKRDGYSEAVQQIDLKTGGDGEYRYCTDHDPDRHTPDPASMIQRIAERFETLNTMESISEINEWKERAEKAEANNSALTARVKELEQGRAEFIDNHVSPLETQLAAARKALEPFSLISSEGVISAKSGHVTVTTCAEYFHEARAALEVKP